jgi:hypothetical protein
LAAIPSGDADNVAGPSTIGPSQSENNCGQEGVEVIEIEGTSYHCYYVKMVEINCIPDSESVPSPRQRRTASPTMGTIENLNTSFSGSFYVDESLKALNPWDANVVNEAWEF